MDNSPESITAKIKELRERAGLSMAAVAKAMGYKTASGYQRYENAETYKGGYLARDWVEGFAGAVAGRGSPPVTIDDVWPLAGPEFKPPAKKRNPLIDSYNPDAEWKPEPEFEGEAYTREEWTPRTPGAMPEIDLKLGAGEGTVGEVLVLEINGNAYSGHRIVREWNFPPDFLHSSGTSLNQSIVGEVIGDSMLPNYLPADKVVIDLAQNTFTADGVYMWSDGFSPPQMKRLQRVPFTNPPRVKITSDNPMYEPYEADIADVKIFGKITWHLGRR
ncbi:hypothetical protein XM25_07975 [Devosia sp. H5989]|nr:hypothetical protein XM25_07975 [Devosia sp. H5989]